MKLSELELMIRLPQIAMVRLVLPRMPSGSLRLYSQSTSPVFASIAMM